MIVRTDVVCTESAAPLNNLYSGWVHCAHDSCSHRQSPTCQRFVESWRKRQCQDIAFCESALVIPTTALVVVSPSDYMLLMDDPITLQNDQQDGQGALNFAASSSNTTQAVLVMKALIAAGADVNAKDSRGGTVLMWSSNVDVAKTIVEAGADVNAKDNVSCSYLPASLDSDQVCPSPPCLTLVMYPTAFCRTDGHH